MIYVQLLQIIFFICPVCAFPTNSQLAFITLFWSFVTFAFHDLALLSLWYCCSFEVIIAFIIFSWGMIIASLFIVLLQLHCYLKNKITSNNAFSRDSSVLYWCIYGSQILRVAKKKNPDKPSMWSSFGWIFAGHLIYDVNTALCRIVIMYSFRDFVWFITNSYSSMQCTQHKDIFWRLALVNCECRHVIFSMVVEYRSLRDCLTLWEISLQILFTVSTRLLFLAFSFSASFTVVKKLSVVTFYSFLVKGSTRQHWKELDRLSNESTMNGNTSQITLEHVCQNIFRIWKSACAWVEQCTCL